MSNTATRLITLIMLLQRKPNQKASMLAEELGVSIRTLHRYITKLDEMGIPIYSERGPNGGFSLVRGYKMPPLIFSPQEAVAIYLGVNLTKELWGNLYREPAQAAMAKLENVLPSEQMQEVSWARRALLATGLNRADLKKLDYLLAIVQPAIRDHLQIQISYHSSGRPKPTERVIHPYALVYRWGWWYVIGYCCLRKAVRTFRVDRIISLQLLNTIFELPKGFDLKIYLDSEPETPMITFTLRFTLEGAGVAQENASLWETIETQKDGSVMVRYKSPSLTWGVSMILSYGPLVEILEPQNARHLIAEWSHKINSFYKSK